MSLLDRLNDYPGPEKDSSPKSAAQIREKVAEVKKVLENLEKNPPKDTIWYKPQNIKENSHDFLKKVLEIHRELINNSELDLNEYDINSDLEEEKKVIKNVIEKFILEIMSNQNLAYSRQEKQKIIEAVINETIGLGPIEELVNDESITEIMVNGYNNIYVEKNGLLQKTDIVFYDDEHVKRIINRIVSRIGRRIDEGMPMVDARLKNGSRVNAIIPPVSLSGPILTIRKFSKTPLSSKDLIRLGSYTPAIEEFLKICVQAKLNIIISGGTGSGKTTLLNVLSSFIPNDERIITIEDSAELKMHQEHVITLETRPPNIENSGEITIRDLVRNSLRMRPDRLVVGEVRGKETLDMLQAMNTGHDGSMTTAHANTPRDLISRLETMVLMAGLDLPVKAIRQQIASAFNLIIHQNRLQDGSRKVISIAEICGIEEDMVVLKDLFVYHQDNFNAKTRQVEGNFMATGLSPNFQNKLEAKGLKFPENLFNNQE